jgi:hypothetical protein
VDGEDLTLVVLLHIAYEVVSHLDRAEAFRSLMLEEQSLCSFFGEHIRSLQLVAIADSSHAVEMMTARYPMRKMKPLLCQ